MGHFPQQHFAKNLHENGLESITASQVPTAMILPAAGMIFGLLLAVLFSYRKPREYQETELTVVQQESSSINKQHIAIAGVGIVAALAVQLLTGSMIIGALAGFMVFTFGA